MSAVTERHYDDSKLLTDLSSYHKQCRTSDDEKPVAQKQATGTLESEKKPQKEDKHTKYYDKSALQCAPNAKSIPF